MLEAVLYEPGAWLPPSPDGRQAPTHAPDATRERLSTPCGLLFNELACSPAATTGAMEVPTTTHRARFGGTVPRILFTRQPIPNP